MAIDINSTERFWSDPTTEPKRRFRFTFDVANLPVWSITKVDRPSFQVSETKHQFYNHTFKYPGRVEWQPITFTTVDPIQPDATGILMKILYASGYEFPDKQFGGNGYQFKSINKVDASDALTPITITSYDGRGTAVEKWSLKNAFITNTAMGSYDYGDDTMLSMDVTMQYDWATIEKLGDRAVYVNTVTGQEVENSVLE
jgi:hypothetical protein